MNKIVKGTIFDGKARVAIVEITDIVNEEIKMHDLSPLAAAALGRTMAVGAYISNNLKNESTKFSITVNGGGILGNIVVAGEGGNFIRGFVANTKATLPLKENGHLDVGNGVGKNGFFTVITDFGLKDAYVGKIPLVSGEIAEDFTQYLYKSEGIENAVALGVRMTKDGCIGAGGIIVEPLPDADDNMICMIEDIMTNFTNVSEIIASLGAEEIFNFYFGHLNAQKYNTEEVVLRCNCSKEKIENIIVGLGEKEAMDIVSEVGKLEIGCQFCGKNYSYSKAEVENLWQK
ncbi:MAG: Hsp33 family molecular chaperone HslO [Clostridia bacterium]